MTGISDLRKNSEGTGADVLKAKATRQLAERLLDDESLRSRRKRNGCATSKHDWQAKRQ
jgi:hypothetical protein